MHQTSQRNGSGEILLAKLFVLSKEKCSFSFVYQMRLLCQHILQLNADFDMPFVWCRISKQEMDSWLK